MHSRSVKAAQGNLSIIGRGHGWLQSWHLSMPFSCLVKVPAGQLLQTRRLVLVQCSETYVPAGHLSQVSTWPVVRSTWRYVPVRLRVFCSGWAVMVLRNPSVAVAVVDPFLPVLGWSQGLLQPCLFHDGTGILTGPLLESPRALSDTAHHDEHQDQQKEEYNHPGQMLVDVEMLVWVLSGMAPLGRLDGCAGLLTGGLHG